MAVLNSVSAVLILVVVCCCLWKRLKPSGSVEMLARRRKSSGKTEKSGKFLPETSQLKKKNTLPVKALSGKNYQPDPNPFKKCQDWIEQVHKENAELYQWPEMEVSGYEEFILGIQAREAFRPVIEEFPTNSCTKNNTSNGFINDSKPTHISISVLGSVNSVHKDSYQSCPYQNFNRSVSAQNYQNSNRPTSAQNSCSQNSDLGYESTPGPNRGRFPNRQQSAAVERAISNRSGSAVNLEQAVYRHGSDHDASIYRDENGSQKEDHPTSAHGTEGKSVKDSNKDLYGVNKEVETLSSNLIDVDNTSQHCMLTSMKDGRPSSRSLLNGLGGATVSPAPVHQHPQENHVFASQQMVPQLYQTVLNASQTHISKETQV